jgi:hypothetical protein
VQPAAERQQGSATPGSAQHQHVPAARLELARTVAITSSSSTPLDDDSEPGSRDLHAHPYETGNTPREK